MQRNDLLSRIISEAIIFLETDRFLHIFLYWMLGRGLGVLLGDSSLVNPSSIVMKYMLKLF